MSAPHCSGGALRELASKVFKTGKQTLYQENDWGLAREMLTNLLPNVPPVYWVRLENRTNDTWVRIPAEKAEIWKELLK